MTGVAPESLDCSGPLEVDPVPEFGQEQGEGQHEGNGADGKVDPDGDVEHHPC